MKKKILVFSFLLFIAWCGIAFSDTCYKVKGTVKTINALDEITQQGRITLQLFDQNGNKAFKESGYLFGRVIESSTPGVTYLTHTATFKDGSMFESSGDVAFLVNPESIECGEDGLPCYCEVHELITNIVKGKGFFTNVSSAAVEANGHINTCEGDNENKFELTGEICFE